MKLLHIIGAIFGLIILGYAVIGILYPPTYQEVYREKTFNVGQEIARDKESSVIYNGYIDDLVVFSEVVPVGFSGETRYYKFHYKKDMIIQFVDDDYLRIVMKNVRVSESTYELTCRMMYRVVVD